MKKSLSLKPIKLMKKIKKILMMKKKNKRKNSITVLKNRQTKNMKKMKMIVKNMTANTIIVDIINILANIIISTTIKKK